MSAEPLNHRKEARVATRAGLRQIAALFASGNQGTFNRWDPGAASARGAADGRGGEVPPPDPQTRGLKLSAVSYRKGCASRRGLVISYIISNC